MALDCIGTTDPLMALRCWGHEPQHGINWLRMSFTSAWCPEAAKPEDITKAPGMPSSTSLKWTCHSVFLSSPPLHHVSVLCSGACYHRYSFHEARGSAWLSSTAAAAETESCSMCLPASGALSLTSKCQLQAVAFIPIQFYLDGIRSQNIQVCWNLCPFFFHVWYHLQFSLW